MTTPIDPMAAVKLLRDLMQEMLDTGLCCDMLSHIAEYALSATASIEQPTSEAVDDDTWEEDATKAGLIVNGLSLNGARTNAFYNGHRAGYARAIATAPPPLPPAKEAILQAMVDQAQELGLYDDVVSARITPEYKAAQKIKNMDARTMLDAVADAPVALANFGPNGPTHWSSSGAPVDERAANVIAWLLLDQGFREPDDFEDFERVVLASEITEEELARFKKDGRATALSIAVFQQSNSSIIHEALDIAFDLVNEEAQRIHVIYKDHKSHKHAAIDADVATVTSARAALQQPGQAEGWVSVEDWLPAEGDLTLICGLIPPDVVSTHKMWRICATFRDGSFLDANGCTRNSALHWMPLPAAPSPQDKP